MKQKLVTLLQQALAAVERQGLATPAATISWQVEPTRDPKHGDYASNLALVLAKAIGCSPRELAAQLVAHLPTAEWVERIELAGPGFINFTLAASAYHDLLADILAAKQTFGSHSIGQGQRVHLEYVSCNPTGPLHVGHGRNAAFGACVANLLTAVGYQVHREYYVNDAGRQMRILAFSTWIRYLQSHQVDIGLPSNAYQGDYLLAIADLVTASDGDNLLVQAPIFTAQIAATSVDAADAEAWLDVHIKVAMQLIGEAAFERVQQITLDSIMADIQDDLAAFGVEFDDWFYESSLTRQGLVAAGIELLRQGGHVYQREGALWFRATDFDDEKDRVLIRENGQPTYFASDVAYHLHKFQQNYDQIIDVFGADHHGYQARIRAFLQGLGQDPRKLTIALIQFVALFRGKEKVSMSTRSGSFVTLRELRDEVGRDAARFFYIMRKREQHLDFDLELAKSTSNENPVYYIQYAHARICSVWRQLRQQNQAENCNDLLDEQPSLAPDALLLLTASHEKNLLRHLSLYPECVLHAATQFEPHAIAHYLQELANLLHTYYNAERFLVADKALCQARLCLIRAIQQVLANGLGLLGVSAPQQM